MERYPEMKMIQGKVRGGADFCATVTPKEMLGSENVSDKISWTKSDNALAEQQKRDTGIG